MGNTLILAGGGIHMPDSELVSGEIDTKILKVDDNTTINESGIETNKLTIGHNVTISQEQGINAQQLEITNGDVNHTFNNDGLSLRDASGNTLILAGGGGLKTEIATSSFYIFGDNGYAEVGTTSYNNSNTLCPQLLLVNGTVDIHITSIKQNAIYHAFWKNGGDKACINFYKTEDTIQTTIYRPPGENAHGGVMFVNDGDTSFGNWNYTWISRTGSQLLIL